MPHDLTEDTCCQFQWRETLLYLAAVEQGRGHEVDRIFAVRYAAQPGNPGLTTPELVQDSKVTLPIASQRLLGVTR